MGYRLIKYIQNNEYNAKCFYLDNGEADLPVIVNKTDILPGSQAYSINSKDAWVLSSEYQWIKCPWKYPLGGGAGGGLADAPTNKVGVSYVRTTGPDNKNSWTVISAMKRMSVEEWKKAEEKPEYTEITDSPFDGQENNMYIDK